MYMYSRGTRTCTVRDAGSRRASTGPQPHTTEAPGDAAGTSFTMTCGTTDYPFRADEPADAEAWVSVISKRMSQTNP